MLGDHCAVRHDFGQDQRVLVFQQASQADGKVPGRDGAVAAGPLAPGPFGPFIVVGGPSPPA